MESTVPADRMKRQLSGPQIAWLALCLLCALYGSFAVAAALGLVEAGKVRAIRPAFVLHALAGGIALLTGAVQFNPAIRARFVRVHRISGRIYVVAVTLASLEGVVSAALFDVSLSARLSFALLGSLWLGSTVVAYGMILQGRRSQHREWMVRSFSLSLFFVSFSLWVPALEGSWLDGEASHTVAVTLSWTFNLLIAEVLILRGRTGRAESR
jgi:uncharacterized membrane protein YozB (DUF420 family)